MTGKISTANSSIPLMLLELGTRATGPASAQLAHRMTVITQSK